MGECTITEVKSKEDSANPIIVTFQNSKLQKSEEKQLKSGIFRNKNRIIAAAATQNMIYSGEVEENSSLKNYLLLRNKLTGEATVIPVDRASLAPYFKRKAPSDTVDNPTMNKSVLDKTFGSKKSKRIRVQKERLEMNVENVKDNLEQTTANIESTENDFDMGHTNENENTYRPVIHRNAESVENIYVLNEMVPEGVLSTLKSEAEGALLASVGELNLCPFIRKCIGELQNSSSSDAVQKCQIFLYINYLISFLNKLARQLTKGPVCATSADVNSHILNNFTILSNNSRTRPVSMRDKTICFILVLSMIALNYELSVEDLSKDIKVGVRKMQEMGRVLAFTSASVKNRNVMVLKLPLPPAVTPRLKKR